MVCVYTHKHTQTVTHHVFFIHSSVDGYLGFFHVLAIVNSTAVNMGSVYLFKLQFCPDIFPGVGLLDHAADFSFLRNLHTVFHRLHQFTVPPTVEEGPPFSTPSQHLSLVDFLKMAI